MFRSQAHKVYKRDWGALEEDRRKHNHVEIFKRSVKIKKDGNSISQGGTNKKKARIALLKSNKILEQGI